MHRGTSFYKWPVLGGGGCGGGVGCSGSEGGGCDRGGGCGGR